jgi:hypothetical protein
LTYKPIQESRPNPEKLSKEQRKYEYIKRVLEGKIDSKYQNYC